MPVENIPLLFLNWVICSPAPAGGNHLNEGKQRFFLEINLSFFFEFTKFYFCEKRTYRDRIVVLGDICYNLWDDLWLSYFLQLFNIYNTSNTSQPD